MRFRSGGLSGRRSLPGWRAVLPIGPQTELPVATHPQLLRDAAAIKPLAAELLRP